MSITKIFNPHRIIQSWIIAIRKFPLAIISAWATAVAAILALEPDFELDQIAKYIVTFALGIPLFTATRLIAKRFHWNYNIREVFLILTGIIFLMWYFYSLPPVDSWDQEISVPVQLLGFIIFFHLVVSYAPFLGKSKDHNFWEFNKQLFANWIVGGIYVLIIYLGLALALLALDQLFGVKIDEWRYAQLFMIVVGFVHTGYFYNIFPDQFRFEVAKNFSDSFFINLCKFVLVPIISLYFIILYAYGIKILAIWELPRGWVASLVLGMSIAGILTYLLNYRFHLLDQSPWIKKFDQYFWWAFLPLIFLLAVAIYRRISDYGITEPRYVVAATTVFLFIITILFIYFDLSKRSRNIIWIPFFLSLFTLGTIIGPVNAIKVSKRNQLNRLIQAFEDAQLLEEGKFVLNDYDLSLEEKRAIQAPLEFLEKRNAENLVINFLPDSLISDRNAWQIEDLYSILKVNEPLDGIRTFSWVPDPNMPTDIFDISNYSNLRSIRLPNADDLYTIEGLKIKVRKNGIWKDLADLGNFYEKQIQTDARKDPYDLIYINSPIQLSDSTALLLENLSINELEENPTILNLTGWLLVQ